MKKILALSREIAASSASEPGRRDAARTPQAAPRGGVDELDRLYGALDHVGPTNHPRSFRLLQSGARKIAQKLIEEAGEVAIDAARHRAHGVVRESADLLYHLVVLWHQAGIQPSEVWQEMRNRAEALGLAEKLPKTVNTTTIAHPER